MEKETNMTEFEAHLNECRLYGVTPLTETEWATLMAQGFEFDAAYGVACDVCNGWSWEEAVEANKI